MIRPRPAQLRTFGLLMAGVCLLIALWPLIWHGEAGRWWAGILSGILGVWALVWPTSLAGVYRVWMRVGEKLGWVNSRLILGVMFYGIFTPVALVMSLLGKTPQVRYDPQAESYRVPKPARDPKHVLKPF